MAHLHHADLLWQASLVVLQGRPHSSLTAASSATAATSTSHLNDCAEQGLALQARQYVKWGGSMSALLALQLLNKAL